MGWGRVTRRDRQSETLVEFLNPVSGARLGPGERSVHSSGTVRHGVPIRAARNADDHFGGGDDQSLWRYVTVCVCGRDCGKTRSGCLCAVRWMPGSGAEGGRFSVKYTRPWTKRAVVCVFVRDWRWGVMRCQKTNLRMRAAWTQINNRIDQTEDSSDALPTKYAIQWKLCCNNPSGAYSHKAARPSAALRRASQGMMRGLPI